MQARANRPSSGLGEMRKEMRWDDASSPAIGTRMNDIEMREEELPIGNSMVESGAKQFKTRFSGPGVRRSRAGADNLLPICAAVLSGRFDQMWGCR